MYFFRSLSGFRWWSRWHCKYSFQLFSVHIFIAITFLSLARIINFSIVKFSRIPIFTEDETKFLIGLVHVFFFSQNYSSLEVSSWRFFSVLMFFFEGANYAPFAEQLLLIWLLSFIVLPFSTANFKLLCIKILFLNPHLQSSLLEYSL